MGVDYVGFWRLVDLASRIGRVEGRSLMLGRQGLHLNPRFRRWHERTIRKYGLDFTYDDLVAMGPFAEPFFERIGLGRIESLDYSEFEGADIVCDLNRPIPDELRGQFDFIFDGGTIEHVFDAPQAVRNVFDMLSGGGVFASINGMNGWPFHGMYQFNPEFVYSFWKRTCGCEVLRCFAQPITPRRSAIELPDPGESGTRLRQRKGFPEGRVYLYYEVRKPVGAQMGEVTLQSDYQAKWDKQPAAEPEGVV